MPSLRSILYLPASSSAPRLCFVNGDKRVDWEIRTARSPGEANRILHGEAIRVVVAGFGKRYDDAMLDLIPEMKQMSTPAKWIALIENGMLRGGDERLGRCIADNFYDFLTMPVDDKRLAFALGHAYGMAALVESPNDNLPAGLGEEQMVGISTVMRLLFRDIRKVAAVDAPVFIAGESGTGKELTARAIHERSSRGRGPFVAIDCGALPPTLIQSELFGYERGAFTGAVQRKLGRIEAAEGGTVFLDEIGDLPLDLQANLLRFLQESTIYRVGSNHPVPVNARVIAATHVNLEKEVQEGRFRQDLYFRLNVLRLRIPPLRERIDDVEVLARFFFKIFAPDGNKQIKGFTSRAVQALRAHDWPGNVRELINRVHRAIVMCDGEWITRHDLDLAELAVPCAAGQLDLEAARAAVEKETIKMAVRSSGNNLSRAARALGISRVTLYRLVDKYGLHGDRHN